VSIFLVCAAGSPLSLLGFLLGPPDAHIPLLVAR